MSNDDLFKSKLYFDLDNATNDIAFSSGVVETTTNTLALAGKTVSNVAVFAGKLGFKILEELPAAVEKAQKRQMEKK